MTIAPTAAWASYELRWDAPITTGFAQGGWGVAAPFSATKLVRVHWQVTATLCRARRRSGGGNVRQPRP